jgi:hypothetical protein
VFGTDFEILPRWSETPASAWIYRWIYDDVDRNSTDDVIAKT